jgi:hypothetical protein
MNIGALRDRRFDISHPTALAVVNQEAPPCPLKIRNSMESFRAASRVNK